MNLRVVIGSRSTGREMMKQASTLRKLAFSGARQRTLPFFSRAIRVLKCSKCTSHIKADSFRFTVQFMAPIGSYLVSRFSSLTKDKKLRKSATSNPFGYADRRIDRLTKRMLVFAVERIDMSLPVQLKPGMSLAAAAFPAQGDGMGRFSAFSSGMRLTSVASNPFRLPESVSNNCCS